MHVHEQKEVTPNQSLLKCAQIGKDAGVVDASDKDAFVMAAKTRQWDRKKTVRTLA